jgi:general secretion pathway protein A
MDYFRILNLNREPFSNSPEPDFFYESSQHLGCLQKLEIAVRLRRGLSVVMGDVGTGKTTLCREFIRRLAETEEDRTAVETHLLLDPAFSVPREFLTTVAITFGLTGSDNTDTEWQLKEYIKNYLFHRGVDERKTVVLIIDEGQKLPEFCLELLREFLNYETNENKLLQIIIFAQNEFREALKNRANFADRINQFIYLKALNFGETRQMIKFRIARASAQSETPPSMFTWPAMWAIYRATGGYPRKIITLCHQIMLTLIIQNKTQADRKIVLYCASQISYEMKTSRRQVFVAASSLAVLLLIVAGFASGILDLRLPGKGNLVQKEPATAVAIPSAPRAPAPVLPALNVKEPLLLGRLIIGRGDTVYAMLHQIYGAYDETQLRTFVRANHPRLENLNRIRQGDILALPAVPARENPLPPNRHWVVVTTRSTLGEAYELIRQYPGGGDVVRLFPYWNRQEGLVFAVLVQQGFADEAAADACMRRLPPDFSSGARVISRWSEGTNYYAR